ncbi:hypothetical protein FOMPIDRAFT_82926 [Fomitopsis schrenkii]|uniref:Uncharacterized protein n=1 Tax=Fomitopsis schrenkii TaxID=2126942 RepID=S8DYJ8_FOMSC|nr:hypothetical protein FOMPIDRAFT_82926 [Fomitopsis schrenkii]
MRGGGFGAGWDSKAPSAAGSGASTPYGHGARSALAATILVEGDEDEQEENVGLQGGVFGAGSVNIQRRRAQPAAQGDGLHGRHSDVGQRDDPDGRDRTGLRGAVQPTALVPVTAMPTSDAELQLMHALAVNCKPKLESGFILVACPMQRMTVTLFSRMGMCGLLMSRGILRYAHSLRGLVHFGCVWHEQTAVILPPAKRSYIRSA